MGQWTNPKVRDGSRDPWGGPGRVGRPSRRFGKGLGSHGEVQDGSEDPRRGPGWVGGPSWRFETGLGTSKRSGMGRGTLG